jgi:hypothetical protein
LASQTAEAIMWTLHELIAYGFLFSVTVAGLGMIATLAFG